MTNNQIQYIRTLEDIRHNKEQERINIYNIDTVAQTSRYATDRHYDAAIYSANMSYSAAVSAASISASAHIRSAGIAADASRYASDQHIAGIEINADVARGNLERQKKRDKWEKSQGWVRTGFEAFKDAGQGFNQIVQGVGGVVELIPVGNIASALKKGNFSVSPVRGTKK